MTLYLEQVFDDEPDWFVLGDGGGWTSVEGTAEEWLTIAEVLASGSFPPGRRYLSMGRCAIARDGMGIAHELLWRLWSPRNRAGARDDVYVGRVEGFALARNIREVVARAVFGAWAA